MRGWIGGAVIFLAATGCGSGGGSTAGDLGPQADVGPGQVPVGGSRLFGWLKAGSYKAFARESAVHLSIGPHGSVRVYLNPTLEASLKASRETHPVNSAAVKEIYESDKTTLKGWAVSVKFQADSADGNGWYWYEVLSVTDGQSPVADGRGLSGCANCHGSGKDYLITRYPLQ